MLGRGLADGSALHVAVIAAATGASWIGSGWLEEAAETLSRYYGLPAVVRGSIVVAVERSVGSVESVGVTTVLRGG